MQDKDYLAEYYGSYDEDSRLLSRHGRWNTAPPCATWSAICDPACEF